MRPVPWKHLEPRRIAGPRGQDCGTFRFHHPPTNVVLNVIVSSGEGWEHVSVSLPNRTPNWREMEFVCRLFWSDDEAVMQLHPPRSGWISNHPHCLHMWRPTGEPIPLPPSWMVGTPALNGKHDLPRREWDARAMAENDRLTKELGV